MKKFQSLLVQLKIFDPDLTLSLSNIALLVLILKLAIAPSLDWTVMTAFFIAILNHNSKKWFQKTKADKQVAEQDRMQKLEDQVRGINNANALRNR